MEWIDLMSKRNLYRWLVRFYRNGEGCFPVTVKCPERKNVHRRVICLRRLFYRDGFTLIYALNISTYTQYFFLFYQFNIADISI